MPRDFRKIFKQKKEDLKPWRARKKILIPHRPGNSRLKIYLISIFLLVLAGSIFYFLFLTDYFLIKNINIFYLGNGKDNLIQEAKIKQLVDNYFQKKSFLNFRKNILFLSSGTVRKEFLQDGRLNSVVIDKQFPDSLNIQIAEVKPIARLVITGGENYLLDQKVRLIPDSENNPKLAGLPTIYDQTILPINQESFELTLSNVSALLETKIDIINSIISFPFIFIQKEAGVIKIVAQSNESWRAFFIPDQNFNQQINNLILVLQEKLQDRSKLEYIDLRFGNRVFYK